ncbi:MAG TPA: phosphopyruvate hydratase [Bdellovibrio sp.]
MPKIQHVHAQEILDSRGNPTLEVEVILDNSMSAKSAVPSGASTGALEAVELRDKDPRRYQGKGVLKAISNVNTEIAKEIKGFEVGLIKELDKKLIALDGTENKSRLGANAILGVSQAATRAAALSHGIPLYQYINKYLYGERDMILPVPMFNVMNGGVHADNTIDFQEFMIAPVGALNVQEAVRMASETYHTLKQILKSRGLGTNVGDEGGFAPSVKGNNEAVEYILEAIGKAGYNAGKDIVIALDPASSEFFEDGAYNFKKSDGSKKTSEEMIEYYEKWVQQYPILSIEDGLAENDWRGWELMTQKMGKNLQLVGDDIFVTNPKIIKKAIDKNVANASLIKLNQIGTVSETLEAMRISQEAGYGTVISHRSGETWDDFIADLAVATGAKQIKTGAPCRGERVAKYNRLMMIEREMGKKATYAGVAPFKGWG